MLQNGKAKLKQQPEGGATVTLVRPGAAVEFPLDKTDQVFTILSEFGDQGTGKLGSTPGPLHNQIPKPDRTPGQLHLLGRTTSTGPTTRTCSTAPARRSGTSTSSSPAAGTPPTSTVTDWVKVPGNASTYGDNAVEDFGGSWDFIQDRRTPGTTPRSPPARPPPRSTAYLAQFDVWDRYDSDSDGDFNEPDGYIDHFQASTPARARRPAAAPGRRRHLVAPLVRQPDRRGRHRPDRQQVRWHPDRQHRHLDRRLHRRARERRPRRVRPRVRPRPRPARLYDTAGGENGTGFWTLMSSGSWLNHGSGDAHRHHPRLHGPVRRSCFLGWLDYPPCGTADRRRTCSARRRTPRRRRPGRHGRPARLARVTDDVHHAALGHPRRGGPGRGDDLNNTLTRDRAGGHASVTVSADLWSGNIEEDYDYLYGEYSTDGGAHWTEVGGPSPATPRKWSSEEVGPTAGRRGRRVQFRFRYATDGGVQRGRRVHRRRRRSRPADTTRSPTTSRPAPTAGRPTGWTVSTGTEVTNAEHYYLLENRLYGGYDAHPGGRAVQVQLRPTPGPTGSSASRTRTACSSGSSTTGTPTTTPSTTPARGYALPVDARPAPVDLPRTARSPSNRRQPFDARLRPGADSTRSASTSRWRSRPRARPRSRPSRRATTPLGPRGDLRRHQRRRVLGTANPLNSVKVAGVGVKATVTSEGGTTCTVKVASTRAEP